jgi:DNA-binding XRE family transcriptional regulator
MATPRYDNYLRTYRRRAGVSQGDLAYLLGAEYGSKVCRYERGAATPKLDTLLAYECLFQAPLRELFFGRYQKVEHALACRLRARLRAIEKKVPTHLGTRSAPAIAALGPDSWRAARGHAT